MTIPALPVSMGAEAAPIRESGPTVRVLTGRSALSFQQFANFVTHLAALDCDPVNQPQSHSGVVKMLATMSKKEPDASVMLHEAMAKESIVSRQRAVVLSEAEKAVGALRYPNRPIFLDN